MVIVIVLLLSIIASQLWDFLLCILEHNLKYFFGNSSTSLSMQLWTIQIEVVTVT